MKSDMHPLAIAHIDDNGLYSNEFKDTFESAVASVFSFRHGDDARSFVHEGKADVLVVDQAGFKFAREIQGLSLVKAVVVLSGAPENAEFDADLKLKKLDIDHVTTEITALIERLTADRFVASDDSSGRDDLFSDMSESQRRQYAGQVLVISGSPERVEFAGQTLDEAEDFIRESTSAGSRFRIVQAPPVEKLTLADMEMA